jgi:hypothetical protein
MDPNSAIAVILTLVANDDIPAAADILASVRVAFDDSIETMAQSI